MQLKCETIFLLGPRAAGPAGALPLSASQRPVLQEEAGSAQRAAAQSARPGENKTAAVFQKASQVCFLLRCSAFKLL